MTNLRVAAVLFAGFGAALMVSSPVSAAQAGPGRQIPEGSGRGVGIVVIP